MAFLSYRFFLPLFLLSLPIFAQQPFAPPSPRVRTYDVQHYVIDSKLDFAKKTLIGETTITLKPMADNFKNFSLDAERMKINSVALSSKGGPRPLQFKYAGGQINVTLDRAYAKTETVSVVVKYATTDPPKGVRFIDEQKEKDGTLINPRQAWTQGEADESRYWFPGYDYPDDKATSEQFITVPPGSVAIGNGEFLGAAENPDGGKTFHFSMPAPHSTYLVSFVAGDYVRRGAEHGAVPIGYYLYRGYEDLADVTFKKTPLMMAAMEQATGIKFPFNKYDQAIVAEFPFGGMENITATTMSDSDMLLGRLESERGTVEDLVSHELGHSWFGNLVTCKTWHQLWLNEGFATYMEAVFREHEGGRDAYLKKIRADAERWFVDELAGKSKRHALVNKFARADDELFDATTYNKGSVVIHMLREEVGDADFWRGVNRYLTRHRFGNVETKDLQAAMEDSSLKDLNWFFNQWIYGAGYPELKVKTSYDAAKKQVVLEIEQAQKPRPDAVAAFRFNVGIEIHAGGAVHFKSLAISKAKETFTFAFDSAPAKILFDKSENTILKKVKAAGTIPVEVFNVLK